MYLIIELHSYTLALIFFCIWARKLPALFSEASCYETNPLMNFDFGELELRDTESNARTLKQQYLQVKSKCF